MTRYVLPLEIIGLLLTAAAIGAVIIAMKDAGKGQLSGPRIASQQTEISLQAKPDNAVEHESEEVRS